MLTALTRNSSAGVGIALISISLLLHMLVAPTVGLGVDEAHYALFGLHPDWSYFDHPPITGWLQWLGLHLGHSEFFVRLPAMLLWALIGWLVFDCAQRWFEDSRVAPIAVALVVFSPIVQVLAFGLVPDTPLIVISLLTVRLVESLDRCDGKRLLDWLGLGLLLGLAGLSKYTAVFIALALLLSWLWSGRWHWLASAGPWLAATLAVVLVAPVFWWNWQQEWVSFIYQLEHGAKGDWQFSRSLRYVLVLVVSFGPLLTVAAVAGLVSVASKSQRSAAPILPLAQRFSYILACVLLLTAVWSAGNGETLPHWTVLSWVLLAPLAANWLVVGAGLAKRVFIIIGAALTGLLFLLLWWLLIAPPLALVPAFVPAVRDLYGWREAAQQAALLKQQLQPSYRQPLQLWVANWTHASRVAWYSQQPVQVLSEGPSQFSLWWGQPQVPALLLAVDKNASDQPTRTFAGHSCKLQSRLDFTVDGVPVNYFSFYLCES